MYCLHYVFSLSQIFHLYNYAMQKCEQKMNHWTQHAHAHTHTYIICKSHVILIVTTHLYSTFATETNGVKTG